jgi:hypothetical protein
MPGKRIKWESVMAGLYLGVAVAGVNALVADRAGYRLYVKGRLGWRPLSCILVFPTSLIAAKNAMSLGVVTSKSEARLTALSYFSARSDPSQNSPCHRAPGEPHPKETAPAWGDTSWGRS